MSLQDLLADVRTWWRRRERASQLIKDMAGLRPGETFALADSDRFALMERVVIRRLQLDDRAADNGPVPTAISAPLLRRNPELLVAATELAARQVHGCVVVQRIIEARGSLELTADDCASVVGYWHWLSANRQVFDD